MGRGRSQFYSVTVVRPQRCSGALGKAEEHSIFKFCHHRLNLVSGKAFVCLIFFFKLIKSSEYQGRDTLTLENTSFFQVGEW